MLEVVEPGLLSTVQDFGRSDAAEWGVPRGGACDIWSLSMANLLVGNRPDAAALEITLAGPTLRVLEGCLVGLAGADLGARIVETGQRLEPGTSHLLQAGMTLAFGSAEERTGIRAYLALAGAIDVAQVLGSASTCLVGGFGGMSGRAVRLDDVMRQAAEAVTPRERRWPDDTTQPALEAARGVIRVLPGPHRRRLASRSFARLVGSEYRVSARGDRQGIVLDGTRLPGREDAAPMLSQGVPWGAVQVPQDGHPICLLADHQTVGGYPVLAVVISADLPLLGQLGPGDPVRFSAVSGEEAVDALRRRQAEWQSALRALDEVDDG
ncbi:biotin-dependent carboxyltransferase family protein [soil metagenome]